jgi:hypothetical protein
LLKQLWSKWKTIITQIGNFWSRIVFTVFYFVIVTPFGLAVRLLSDPLHTRHRDETTFWHPKTLPEPTVEEARKQF